MRERRRWLAIFAIAALISDVRTADAQDRLSKPITLQQSVEPAFHVTPIVHHFESTRGKTIPFEFTIESIDRPTTIQVQAVALRQDDKGTMLPADGVPAPENIRLYTPAEMRLADNETRAIRGQIRVPFSDSKFHSFGILVTDLGRIVGTTGVSERTPGQRRVGVRFVTRYVLRIDLTVTNVRGGDITKLDLESAELIEEEGHGRARLWVSNPTDGPFEFQVQCRLTRPNQGKRFKPFYLGMPIRQSVEPPERWTVRILPESRLQLIELLPEAVFPGEYEMQIDLLTNHRRRISKTFPITIRAGDFPAQDATIIQVRRDITISPPRVELSFRRGGRRFIPLEIANTSKQTIEINMAPRATNDDKAQWFVVRPDSVTLRPGTARKVLVAPAPALNLTEHQYGTIRLHAVPEQGQAIGAVDIPVALLSRSDQLPGLRLGKLYWDGDASFVVPVENSGKMHLPLNGALTLIDGFGRSVNLQGGFGRWLMPSEVSKLVFSTNRKPPAGDYRVQLRVDAGEGSEAVSIDEVLRISPPPAVDSDPLFQD